MRDGDPLPKGWEEPIPERIWPEALLSAVRADLGALGAPRVIETIRRWQREAKDPSDSESQREARSRLRALGDAIAQEDTNDLRIADFDVEGIATQLPELSSNDAFTVDSYDVIPRSPAKHPGSGRSRAAVAAKVAAKPAARIASNETPHAEMMVEEDAILREDTTGSESGGEPGLLALQNEGSAPPHEFVEEDENPTMLRDGEELSVGLRFYRAARVDPFSEEDEKPTASIPIPEELARRGQEAEPAVSIPSDDTKEVDLSKKPPSVKDEQRPQPSSEERTVAIREPASREHVVAAPSLSVVPAPSASPPSQVSISASAIQDDVAEGKSGLAPKPGIVRRRAMSRKQSPARPRAAMQQVRALHAVVLPLCEELIPLTYERRSRRFWARWREVAGDRGVRREFIESLLLSARDVRTLVCELIAEVQTVDVRSVHALVEKLESGTTGNADKGAPKPVVPLERQRGPLVGASVRVEGIAGEEED